MSIEEWEQLTEIEKTGTSDEQNFQGFSDADLAYDIEWEMSDDRCLADLAWSESLSTLMLSVLSSEGTR